MAKKGRDRDTEAAKSEMDMTPMIDVTFNLIIFFMIVSEISQQDLTLLELPGASEAIDDEQPAKDRLILNVARDPSEKGKGHYYVRGIEYFVKTRGFNPPREQDLEHVLSVYAKDERWWGKDPNTGKAMPGPKLCEAPLLLRADKQVTYEWVQHVMQVCALNPNIKIYKLQMAIKKESQ